MKTDKNELKRRVFMIMGLGNTIPFSNLERMREITLKRERS